MKTVGYAIVGTGYFGAELGRIMKEEEGAKIVAVLDPENAESVAEELGCDVETDLDILYSREDVDAVIVASPNYLHKEPVVKAAADLGESVSDINSSSRRMIERFSGMGIRGAGIGIFSSLVSRMFARRKRRRGED